jgi:hypothetical protein
MQALNGRYAQSFNRKRGTVGHVFRRRYDDVLIQSDAHLFECIRYVALNPVRGGLCRRPEDWEWGSYRSVALVHRPSSYFDPAVVLKYFGRPTDAARSRFTAFVNAGLAVPRAA